MRGARASLSRKLATAILAVALVVVAVKMTADGVGIDWLRSTVAQAGPWAPVVYVALRASTYIIAPLSIPGIEIAAGLLFGIWQGAALAVLGQTLGGSTNFWIARLLGGPAVERVAGRLGMARIEELYSRVQGWRGLLFARLVLPGYDFLSYAAGLTPLRFREYLLVTAAGGIPSTFVHVALGVSLAGDPWMFVAASFGFALLYGGVIFVHRWRAGRARRASHEGIWTWGL